jgi:formamidopyrimidine-DNA glycosylase
MPELPEVETIRRGLASHLPHKKITCIEVRNPKSFRGNAQDVIGRSISGVERQGKVLQLRLDDGRVMAVHLKMTGQLIWKAPQGESVMGGHPEQSYIDSLPSKHSHVVITFDDASVLYFNDVRKFGWVHVMTQAELEAHDLVKRMGPEPLSEHFTATYLEERVRKYPKKPIKSFLLDQVHIAGLGNIYADESLFRAGIHPQRLTGSLSHEEIVTLASKIKETLQLALDYGGSSERDYLNAIGEKGTYLKVAKVYHRTDKPCVVCGTPIERIKIGGRSSHFCPHCQK